MKTRTKTAIVVLGVVVVCAVLGVAGRTLLKISAVGAGRVAKLLCSNVFVSGRTPEDVLHEELADMGGYVQTDVDYEGKQVTASLGPTTRRAVYRQGLGCTVVFPTDGAAVGGPVMASGASSTAPQADAPWPEGTLVSLDELPAQDDDHSRVPRCRGPREAHGSVLTERQQVGKRDRDYGSRGKYRR